MIWYYKNKLLLLLLFCFFLALKIIKCFFVTWSLQFRNVWFIWLDSHHFCGFREVLYVTVPQILTILEKIILGLTNEKTGYNLCARTTCVARRALFTFARQTQSLSYIQCCNLSSDERKTFRLTSKGIFLPTRLGQPASCRGHVIWSRQFFAT